MFTIANIEADFGKTNENKGKGISPNRLRLNQQQTTIIQRFKNLRLTVSFNKLRLYRMIMSHFL